MKTLLVETPTPQKSNNQQELSRFLNRGQPPCDYEKQLFENHPERIKAILEGKIVPPYEVEIQPSSICNLSCKHCFGHALTNKPIPDKINKKEIEKIARKINKFKENGFKIETIKFCGTTGEPLVNPTTLYAINLFKKLGKNIILFTNGLYLDKKYQGNKYLDYVLKANKLNLSLDVGSEETFKKLKRRKGFNRIIRSLEELIEKRNKTNSGLNIIISYVIGTENYHEITKTTKLIKDLGADEIRFRVDFTHTEKIHSISEEIISKLKRAKQYQTKDFIVTSVYSNKEIEKEDSVFHAYEKKCFNQHFWACIGPDAELYSCGHRTYHGVESYGSLLDSSFRELWTSKKRLTNLTDLPDDHCKFCSPSSKRRNTFMTFLEQSELKI